MNLKQLEYFVQVAELGSFSKAAGVLGIAQPALSRQARSLETELTPAIAPAATAAGGTIDARQAAVRP